MALALPAGYRLRAHDELASTSAEAMRALRDGEPGGLWVTANRQTEGRGRRGRRWSTERGNLAASLALLDPAPRAKAATLSFVAALALHQAIVGVAGPAVAERLDLKWPNDVLLDGLKVAGILIEGTVLSRDRFGVVVGIGVNCASHPSLEGALPSGSLMEQGIAVSAEDLFPVLADNMAREITRWDGGSGFAVIRRAWLARTAGVGQAITVRLVGRTVDGMFEDIDAEGRLSLQRSGGGRELFAAGDIFFENKT